MDAFATKPGVVIHSSLDDSQPERGLFALFKGESGAGKTVGALSFPDPLVLDFDRKMPAIGRKHFPNKKIQYANFKNIAEVCDFLQDNLVWPETLVADSLTSLVKLTLDSISESRSAKVPDMIKKIGAKAGAEFMSIDYYQIETRFISWFIDQLHKLHLREGNPKNVILTAHIMVSESAPDLKTKLVTKTRSIVTEGRRIAAYVPTQYDDVWLFGLKRPDLGEEGKRPRHVVLTETFGDDSAKTAYNLPYEIDFTNGSLYDQVGLNL